MVDHAAEIERIKRLTLTALFSEDELVHALVLKGGNALSLAFNIKSRASFDLDFSMEGAFDLDDLGRIRERIEHRFVQAFKPEGYVVFDVTLESKPETITPDMEEFWGGYSLEFKIIAKARYNELRGVLSEIRREAMCTRPGGRARFEIDISSHEYCRGKKAVEIDQFTCFVYTPSMVVCEKIRALCQQTQGYCRRMKKQRAIRTRDFFDIYEAITRLEVYLFSEDNLNLLRAMFDAKKVPYDSINALDEDREHHRLGWEMLRATVDPGVDMKTFDFYFDYVMELRDRLAQKLSTNPRGT